MTDRDVDQDNQRRNGAPARGANPAQSASGTLPKAGKRADPTEPEVPSAKRVRTIRRQRSMVLVGAAVLGLLSVIVFLLYKAGQRVTTSSGTSSSADPTVRPLDSPAAEMATLAKPEGERAPLAAIAAVPASTTNAAASSSSAARAGTPRPRGSVPSTDIFRKPAF